MKNVSWSTIVVVVLAALVIFMTWGAFGGMSGRMGSGWSMMGSGWGIWSGDPSMSEFAGGMFFLTLAFIVFIAALVLWVARNLGKRNSPTIICPNCGRSANASRYTCEYCGIRL